MKRWQTNTYSSIVNSTRQANNILFLVFALVISTSVQSTEDIYGIVVSIADGDTVTLKADDTTHKIRLAEIDTPERDQSYGLAATSALTDLLLGHQVQVKVVKESDRYGRVIGRIFIEQKDVSAYMAVSYTHLTLPTKRIV